MWPCVNIFAKQTESQQHVTNKRDIKMFNYYGFQLYCVYTQKVTRLNNFRLGKVVSFQ